MKHQKSVAFRGHQGGRGFSLSIVWCPHCDVLMMPYRLVQRWDCEGVGVCEGLVNT